MPAPRLAAALRGAAAPWRQRRWFHPSGVPRFKAEHPAPKHGTVGEERTPHQVVQEMARLIEADPGAATQFAACIDVVSLQKLNSNCDALQDEDNRCIMPPNKAQLKQVGVANAIPFVGFGILDNGLMITCGEYIDGTLCLSFGFSTMAAAALGNTISDAGGVFSGNLVEDIAARYGITAPALSRAQEEMAATKRWERVGQLFGVVVGCLIGMFPLLLIDTKRAERLKREKTVDDLFNTVIEGLATMLEAEAAVMMFYDEEHRELYTRSTSETMAETRMSIDSKSILATVARTGRFLNIENLPETVHFDEARHTNFRQTGINIHDVLCMPIIGVTSEGKEKILGAVEVVNKAQGRFTERDEEVLSALCAHIATAVGSAQGDDTAFQHTMRMCERSLNNRGFRINAAQQKRNEELYSNVLSEMKRSLDVQAIQLLTVDHRTKELVTKGSSGVPAFRSKASKGIMGKVVDSKRTIVVEDVPSSPYYDPDRHVNYLDTGISVRSVLCRPIVGVSGEVIAVLEAVNKRKGHFTDDDIVTVGAISNQMMANLEGNDNSLRRAMVMLAEGSSPQQPAAKAQHECSKELLALFDASINLAHASGGTVDPIVLQEARAALAMSTAGR